MSGTQLIYRHEGRRFRIYFRGPEFGRSFKIVLDDRTSPVIERKDDIAITQEEDGLYTGCRATGRVLGPLPLRDAIPVAANVLLREEKDAIAEYVAREQKHKDFIEQVDSLIHELSDLR